MKHSFRFSRLLALLLVSALLFCSLAGCGNKTASEESQQPAESKADESADTGEKAGIDEGFVAEDSDDEDDMNRATKSPLKPYDSSMQPEKKRPFTLIVYMIGADLESQSSCASKDLLEMMESGLDSSKVNLVVYTGGASEWAMNIPSNRNLLLQYDSKDETMYIVGQSARNNNMGLAATLTDALKFSAKYFPADRYGLVFWDHGGGSVLGFGCDELYNNDGLELTELARGLKNSPFGKQKLAFIGFDACLMGTLEVANALSPYAEYLIASEEVEPGCGWDYAVLGEFTGKEKIPSFADDLTDYYMDSVSFYFSQPDMTLSCVDLSKLDAVNTAADSLFKAMSGKLKSGDFTKLSRVRGSVKTFGADYGYDQVDLYHLAKLFNRMFPTESKNLCSALDKAIVCNVSNVNNAAGLSLYFPYNGAELYYYYAEPIMSKLFPKKSYSDFMTGFVEAMSGGRTVSRSIGIAAPVENDVTLQLSPEELETLASAEYSIYGKEDDGGYSPMVLSLPVTPDENGLLRISKQQDVVYFVTDAGYSRLIPVEAIAEEEGRIVFKTTKLRVTTNPAMMPYMDHRNCTAVFHVPDGYETGIVQSFTYDSDRGGDRNEVDLSLWDSIYYFTPSCTPTRAEDGSMLPYAQWETESTTWFSSCPVNEEFHFELRSLEDEMNEYVVQFTIRDVYGNEHASELFDLEAKNDYTVEEIETDGGTMVFAVFDDHAVLEEYSLDIEKLDIPAEVGGKPVTHIEAGVYNPNALLSNMNMTLKEVRLPDTIIGINDGAFQMCYALETVNFPEGLIYIGRSAFSSCEKLKSIKLPDTLESIGDYAFAFCGGTDYGENWDQHIPTGLTEITLPVSLTYLGCGAFCGCTQLQTIRLEDGLKGLHLTDGVLFSDDGVLVCYPDGLEQKSYTVPADTLSIGEAAFAYSKLEELILNEGLLTAENHAFFSMDDLTKIVLPDSLEVLGAYAFGGEPVMFIEDRPPIEEFHIGDNLTKIGTCALSNLKTLRFSVSEKNDSFSTDGMLLMDKTGSVLHAVAYISGSLTLPDGICTIKERAFDLTEELEELILPDSVMTLAFQASMPEKVSIGAGLRNLSVLTFNIYTKEITLSPDNEVFRIEDGQLLDQDDTVYWTDPSK